MKMCRAEINTIYSTFPFALIRVKLATVRMSLRFIFHIMEQKKTA